MIKLTGTCIKTFLINSLQNDSSSKSTISINFSSFTYKTHVVSLLILKIFSSKNHGEIHRCVYVSIAKDD